MVTVNGCRVYQGNFAVDPVLDEICIDGKIANIVPDLYFIMNKQSGMVCSSLDGDDRSVFGVIDPAYLSVGGRVLHTVGRLDIDTEGMLILTTDGILSHYLSSPESHINKTYFVKLRDKVDCLGQEIYKNCIYEGLEIPPERKEPGFKSKRGILEFDNEQECFLTISEGKFHQVKRMFLALGNQVVYLKRTAMGDLNLDSNLGLGEYRLLTSKEIDLLCPRIL